MKLKKILYTCFLFLFVSLPVFAVQIDNPATGFFVTAPGTTFQSITLFFIKRLLELSGIVAVLFIIIGGYQYIASGANQEMAESGKRTLTNAIIGLVIVILSYILVVAVVNALVGNVRPTG